MAGSSMGRDGFTRRSGLDGERNRESDLVRTLGFCLCVASLAASACGSKSDTGTRAGAQKGAAAAAGKGAGGSVAAIPGGNVPTHTPGGGTMAGVGIDAGPPCVHLQCQKHSCAGGGTTTISGKVYDPAGRNPLYNIAVYVPNDPVAPLKTGASCDTCTSLYTGNPVAAASTDATGKFTMMKAPDGPNIPLVIQVGKWRRQFTLPNVVQCQDNPVPDKMLTLPKNHMEGDIPNVAISTGGADTLECLLRRIGIDPSEYTPGPGGAGRLHIFKGSDNVNAQCMSTLPQVMGGGNCGGGGHQVPDTAPGAPMSSAALWDTADNLMMYDIVLLSCEGEETVGMNQQALHDYASNGGRVFASHFHYAWFNTGPYGNENLATWSACSNSICNINATIVTTLPNGQPFPKGMALFDWLGTVGALTNGELPIEQARHNADVAAANRPSQTWIVADPQSPAPGATEYFSFNTPTDAQSTPDGPAYCGRVVYSDLHVGAASGDDPRQPVPMECTSRALSPQEKALEFMLFDLSSCLTPDDRPPQPPTVSPSNFEDGVVR